MNGLSTLSEFLEACGARLQFYDMGRRVSPIARDDFVSFEVTQTPYPLPLQRQAWLGLLLRHDADTQTEDAIWFLRFALDEQAKLVLAGRDDFMRRLLETLDKNLTLQNAEQIQALLAQSPCAFRPKPERMAVLHAKVTSALQQPPSQYYKHARDYFSGRLGWDQWTFLGYQGIADLAARLERDGNTGLLAEAILQLPSAPLEALCHCLENEQVTRPLARSLLTRAEAGLRNKTPDPQILTAAIRGISQTAAEELKRELLAKVLAHETSRRSDILAAIAGRAWEALADETLRRQFLQRLAENVEGQAFFDGILSDLLYLPATHQIMLNSLRDPQRSNRLNEAIGQFFARLRNQ